MAWLEHLTSKRDGCTSAKVLAERLGIDQERLSWLVDVGVFDAFRGVHGGPAVVQLRFEQRDLDRRTFQQYLRGPRLRNAEDTGGASMWRSVGWLFAHGWDLDDAMALFVSGIVPVKEDSVEQGRFKRVWIEENDSLDELKRAARFATEGQRR